MLRPWKGFRDTGILAKKKRDTGFFVNIYLDQCFLNFGDICYILCLGYRRFFKIIKGIGDTGPPSRA